MTLIQTVFTNRLIIQVSDRRLTKGMPNSKSILIDDENYTKGICWNGTFTAGFTGISRVDRRGKKLTAHWIAEVLSDCPTFEHGVTALHQEAGKRIKKLPKNWDRRLAIVIAGFDHRREPLVASILNFDIATGVSQDPHNFECLRVPMRPGHDFGTYIAGAQLDDFQLRLLKRYVPRMLRQENGVNRAARMMVKIQRLVAEQNRTVGKDALCVYIPKVQATSPGQSLVMSNLGGPDIPTGTTSFGFFDKNGWQFEQRGPISAQQGFVQEFWASADPDNPDYQSVSTRFLKVPSSWQK
ncbi:hypothetical protein JMUB5695_01859 [Mycobacterium heckeshornense]|uniref:hypothetical protein n=1 Tax=Mycobacterium heckeshornense TaxID=110505 RepID=UPI0019435C20|nr:hypothetical protein [Mycobacterium heckeshornense]BCQ08427.1 hypothetical protein JMUB5695_01859 [Mycobacterium heckeshornense]